MKYIYNGYAIKISRKNQDVIQKYLFSLGYVWAFNSRYKGITKLCKT